MEKLILDLVFWAANRPTGGRASYNEIFEMVQLHPDIQATEAQVRNAMAYIRLAAKNLPTS